MRDMQYYSKQIKNIANVIPNDKSAIMDNNKWIRQF